MRSKLLIAAMIAVIVLLGLLLFSNDEVLPPVYEGSSVGKLDIKVGETGVIGGVSITLNNVVQDSRCPLDVQCIQAGSVTANIKLLSGVNGKVFDITSGEPAYRFYGHEISIVNIEPAPYSDIKIDSDAYKITFGVDLGSNY